MITALLHRLGRRGAFLLLHAGLMITIGITLHYTPATTPAVLTTEIWAIIWLIGGVTCLVCAWLCAPYDATGFAIAITILFFWGTADLLLWFQGTPYIWFNTVLWWSLALHTSIVAGWPEAVRLRITPLPTEISDVKEKS